MKPEEQRIAIAGACGYPNPRMGVFGKCYAGELPNLEVVPDYLNDLNAIHEAVNSTISNPELEYKYGETLARITIGPERDEEGFAPNGWGYFAVARATAAQRAEAFLRTLNLWTE
jgi:hypothetical protein